MKRFAFPIVFAIAVLGTTALAQQAVQSGTFLARWDANNDGKVTLAEIEVRRAALFDTYDKNDDGALSAAEFDRVAPQSVGGRQTSAARGTQGAVRYQIDTNGDGLVSRSEYIAGSQIWRDRMDLDGNGVLTTADFGRGGRGMGGAGHGRGLRWNNG